MPEILIRGMEMPGSCAACDFYNVISGCCTRTGTKINFSELTTRSVDCPISELQPHGDLIDRDRLKHKFCTHCDGYEYDTNSCVDGDQDCMDARLIMNAPVIVPAEKGETQ